MKEKTINFVHYTELSGCDSNFQLSIFNFYVGDKYTTLSEHWRKVAKDGVIPHRK